MICPALLILQNAGVLQNGHHCAHPCTYDILTNVDKNEHVVVDHHFITAKDSGVAAEFAFAIIEHLQGESMASKIKGTYLKHIAETMVLGKALDISFLDLPFSRRVGI